MSKILIIDSHKSSSNKPATNLHWLNAKLLANHLNADLIWSYPTVNDSIKSGYDKIIFVHASAYSYVDFKWLEQSPDAKLYFITNEFNLGESRILWIAIKQGRRYEVIANHPPEPSKVVKKYTTAWHNVNLNALSFNPVCEMNPTAGYINQVHGIAIGIERKCIYYGSFRKDRIPSFQKYLHAPVILSTHSKNEQKFRDIGVDSEIRKRIDWNSNDLQQYQFSLYIEDETTHKYYNYLANRFYEALNYGLVPIFTSECKDTIEKSGYNIPSDLVVDSLEQLIDVMKDDYGCLLSGWKLKAQQEKDEVLKELSSILA